MSSQTVFVNPEYATNNNDPLAAGFYVTSPSNSNLALRTYYSNINIAGEIRFVPMVGPTGSFQGYNGSQWVNFNANTGPTGPSGKDFTNQVNFNNGTGLIDTSNVVTYGEVFATTTANVALNLSNVNVRGLYGGNVTLSSLDDVQSLVIAQNSNVITLTSQPLPYMWDNATSNLVATYKSSSGDALFKAYGETVQWQVLPTSPTINKGTAVRLSTDGVNKIGLVPLNYLPSIHIDPFSAPYNILGIALNNAIAGSNCTVCTKGITTVLCTSNISLDFSYTAGVTSAGLPGLVGCDGGIFCNSSIPIGEYIRAGFFLENGLSVAANGNYILFQVDPKLSSG
jgi:hypothetical protein